VRIPASRRRVCRWLGINRKLMQRQPRVRDDGALRTRLETLAAQYRRYGLPRMLVLLRREGITDNHKRVGRVYRAAQLQVRKRVRRKLALGRGIPPRSWRSATCAGRWTSCTIACAAADASGS
jgi:putative transposase